MKKLLDLEIEIANGQENAKKAKELYQLLSSYNAYSILLLKAKQEKEEKKSRNNQYYTDSDCYKNQSIDLFSIFNADECLRGKEVSEINQEDMIFLIDQDTLFRIYSFDNYNSMIGGLSSINYDILKIDSCIAKVYKESVYCGDPLYYDSHSEDKDAFGLFYNNRLITPGLKLNNKLKKYDNKDIRKILKIQSLDEIHDKITEAKNTKAKKLILTK